MFLQKIDIAVAPMIMTADREEVIDFVEPTFAQTGISIGEKYIFFKFFMDERSKRPI